MRPSALLLSLLAAWAALAFAMACIAIFTQPILLLKQLWLILGAVLGVATLLDALRPGPLQRLTLARNIAHSLALGAKSQVELIITNNAPRNLAITLAEPHCPQVNQTSFPMQLTLNRGEEKRIRYPLVPVARGEATLGRSRAWVLSPWRLWQHRVTLGHSSELKIYPNFAPIAQIAHLGIEQHVRQLGVHLAQKRGEGMEFKQLRDFVEGDAMRQVDWKATARHNRPISREYQDERNQDVFFLLDCGRRLRHKEGDLSHFDHALNAILLTGYIAMRQGDGAGFNSFAGSQRWLDPVKGHVGITTLMETLYDLKSTTQNSDFLDAAQQFIKRHRRRCLVVLVSNIRPEDNDDLIQAVQLLSKYHVVTVASLRENFIDDNLGRDIDSFQQALDYAGTHKHNSERKTVARNLRARRVSLIDTEPEQLHMRLVDEYFRIKRSGVL